jgi:hypothetical protein
MGRGRLKYRGIERGQGRQGMRDGERWPGRLTGKERKGAGEGKGR